MSKLQLAKMGLKLMCHRDPAYKHILNAPSSASLQPLLSSEFIFPLEVIIQDISVPRALYKIRAWTPSAHTNWCIHKMTIGSLPHEILACIFLEAACHCNDKYTVTRCSAPSVADPIVLSSVCAQWRQVVIGYQQLWTHIDLAVNASETAGTYHRPDVWIERSRCASLYVHVRQYYSIDHCISSDVDDTIDVSFHNGALPLDSMVRRLKEFLVPLFPRVRSMALSFYAPYHCLISAFVDWWAVYGSHDHPKTLRMINDTIQENLSTTQAWNLEFLPYMPDKSFYKSLETFHLLNITTRWPDVMFSSLVELQIKSDKAIWRTREDGLRTIFSSSPNLEYLTLHGLHAASPPTSNPEPIALNKLRALYIDGSFHSGFTLPCVLNLIDAGQNELHMYISLSGADEPRQQALPAIRSFLLRCNVTTLHVRGSLQVELGRSTHFADQLGPFPRVNTLVLHHVVCCDAFQFWSSSSFSPKPGISGAPKSNNSATRGNSSLIGPRSVLWPDLQELYLNQCVLERSYLYRIVSLHHMQTLHMFDCTEHLTLQAITPAVPKVLDEYMQLLTSVVPIVAIPNTKHVRWTHYLDRLTSDLKRDFIPSTL